MGSYDIFWIPNVKDQPNYYFENGNSSKRLKRKLINSLESVAQRCSVKKVFLEISQNPQENTCTTTSFLIKLQAWSLQIY